SLLSSVGLAFRFPPGAPWLGFAGRLAPAFSPAVLSLILILIGLITVARAFLVAGPPMRDVAVKALAIITASVLLFGLTVQGAGLAIAIILLVVVSAAASPRFRPLASIVLGLALPAFCVL